MDFDLRFATHNLDKMQAALSNDDRCVFKLSWQNADWQRYLHTYMAGLQHQVFRQSVNANAAEHDFQPWLRPPPYAKAVSKQAKQL